MASVFDAFTNSDKLSELCERLRNGCETAGGLAIKAAGNADAKTAAAIAFAIGGKLYSLAAQATLDLSALCPGTIAAGSSAGVFFFVDAGGTVTASLVPVTGGAIVCPDHPITKVCFGAIKIVNASASVFTVGTTLLDAASITATYSDLATALPGHAL